MNIRLRFLPIVLIMLLTAATFPFAVARHAIYDNIVHASTFDKIKENIYVIRQRDSFYNELAFTNYKSARIVVHAASIIIFPLGWVITAVTVYIGRIELSSKLNKFTHSHFEGKCFVGMIFSSLAILDLYLGIAGFGRGSTGITRLIWVDNLFSSFAYSAWLCVEYIIVSDVIISLFGWHCTQWKTRGREQ
jgi:hypothetical protein